jgi:hypothetical protein
VTVKITTVKARVHLHRRAARLDSRGNKVAAKATKKATKTYFFLESCEYPPANA